MAIDYPLWYTLKQNSSTQLKAIATEEAAISAGRDFEVSIDRWRPYIEAQHKKALVNIMVNTVNQASDRSANRRSSLDNIDIIFDMYAVGEAGEVLPVDEIAAMRLDLLVAQVREGLTRLTFSDFGFSKDVELGHIIDHSLDFALNYFDQESQQATGQYAPARWSVNVQMPFIPTDDREYENLENLVVSVSDETLELFALNFEYDHS